MKQIFWTGLALPLFAAGLLAQTGTTAKKAPAAGTAKKAAPAGVKKAPARHSLTDPATLNDKAPETYSAKFTTTKGDFTVEVTRAWAPLAADRFYNLVKYGYFTNASFFRVLPGFVVQFGINATPALNKVWQSANILDEPVKESNHRGYLTFAKSGMPNSRTTQLFINLGDNQRLDGMGFAAFGKVGGEGMTVVDSIYSGYGESPDQDAIQSKGKPYLDANFPQLDSVKTAVIVGAPVPAAPAARPAARPPVRPTPKAAAPKPATP